MSKKIVDSFVKLINTSLRVDANSTSTTYAFQPKLPKNYNDLKNAKFSLKKNNR